MRTVAGLLDLSGRVALVTGGAGHIGSAIAEALAEWGCCGVVVDLKPCREWDDIDDVIPYDWQWRSDADIYYTVQDITSADGISATLEKARRIFGRLDILVNCAAYLDGPGLDVPFAEQTAEDMDRSWAVNLRAPILLTQACLPMLRTSGHGSVINISSIYGMVGPDYSLYEGTTMGNGAAYAATKGGLIQLTRWLATTLAPEVRVNAIVPGGMARGQDAAFVERYCQRVPLGRMGKEEEIKGVAAWLASDASAYVTGQCIGVEGGWLSW